MIKLFYKYEKIEGGQQDCLVLILDSMVEWDAEDHGKEPGYEIFASFLAEFISMLANKGCIKGAFVERGIGKKIVRELESSNILFERYPKYEPESLLQFILSKLGSDKKVGSGIAIIPKSKDEILEVINCAQRPLEWLFFVVGGKARPDWSDFQPFYLLDMDGEGDKVCPVDAGSIVVYHDVFINHCEVHLFSTELDLTEKALKSVCEVYEEDIVLSMM